MALGGGCAEYSGDGWPLYMQKLQEYPDNRLHLIVQGRCPQTLAIDGNIYSMVKKCNELRVQSTNGTIVVANARLYENFDFIYADDIDKQCRAINNELREIIKKVAK